jgi:DnaJ-class molecular chaperone
MKCMDCQGKGYKILLNPRRGVKRCSNRCKECSGTGKVASNLINGLRWLKGGKK